MIKTVIFDLGGVLIDLDMERCFKKVKALGVDMDALTSDSTTEESREGSTICEGKNATGMMHQYQIGKVSTKVFIDSLAKRGRPGTTYQQALDAWNSCLLTIPQFKLDFVKELRAKGYQVFLLSNTNDAHWQYIKENDFPEPVEHYFEYTFLSQEMGLAKPDEKIYTEVLRQICMSAGECLFIDDSLLNCKAAEALGIHTYNAPERTDFRAEVMGKIERLYFDRLSNQDSKIEK